MSVNKPIQTIENDQSKALRAPKDVHDDAHEEAELVDNPRTAIRYVGVGKESGGFQVVTTGLMSFPLGKDSVSLTTRETVEHWAEHNDLDLIDVEDDDGFEPTGFPTDPLQTETQDGEAA